MTKQNRPYNAIQLFQNLHGEVGETEAVKVLTALTESGQLQEKAFGKQKVYWVNQNNLQVPDKASRE